MGKMIEVDLDLFDDDELIKQLESDGYSVLSPGERDTANTLIDAFKIGAPDALERTKRFLEDVTGRTI